MINKSNSSFTPPANETSGQLIARLIARANGGLNSAIDFNNEIVDVVNQMQIDINTMREVNDELLTACKVSFEFVDSIAGISPVDIPNENELWLQLEAAISSARGNDADNIV